jgi:hypothetical protein
MLPTSWSLVLPLLLSVPLSCTNSPALSFDTLQGGDGGVGETAHQAYVHCLTAMNPLTIALDLREKLGNAYAARNLQKVNQFLSSLESLPLGPAAVLQSRIFEIAMHIRTNEGVCGPALGAFFAGQMRIWCVHIFFVEALTAALVLERRDEHR